MWDKLNKNKLWIGIGRIGDFFVLNVIWLIASLPIVTIGASTTALYYVFLKRLHDPNIGLSDFQLFKKSFKENWKQATVVWLILLFLGVDLAIIGSTLYLNMGWEAIRNNNLLLAVGVIIVLAYLLVFLYVFPLLALFQQKTGQCFRNAFAISFRFLPSSLGMVLIVALVVFASWFGIPIFLIGAAFTAWLLSKIIYKKFLKCMLPSPSAQPTEEELPE